MPSFSSETSDDHVAEQLCACEESDVRNPEYGIVEELQAWAVCNRITHTAVTSLLKLLKRDSCFSSLPCDARSLLKTPRAPGANVVAMGLGQYCHFGLGRGLIQALGTVRDLPSPLTLSFNTGGLPVSKSSRSQIWPILCLVTNCKAVSPFPVGVFAGDSKLSDANEFLTPFVDEP